MGALLFTAACLIFGASALEADTLSNPNNIRYMHFPVQSVRENASLPVYESEEEISPTYVSPVGLGRDGWFFGVSAGTSAFVGEPLGCDDLYGRLRPAFQFSLGKWIIPTLAMRLQYQGYTMQSGLLETQDYHAGLVDMMFDPCAFVRYSDRMPRAYVAPFAGCGMLWNATCDVHPFALHYGLHSAVRLSRHTALSLEISSIETFRNFDGEGCCCMLGDRLLNATLGLSVTLGNRWMHRKVVDAGPYIAQNGRLLKQCSRMKEQLEDRERTLEQYRRILEIRGLLAPGENSAVGGARNTYHGLESLRRRLEGKEGNMEMVVYENLPADVQDSTLTGYASLISRGRTCIGAPILFFFRLGTTDLTDPSQSANLDEIAEIVKRHSLTVCVVGAADSATGTEETNRALSMHRSAFIVAELISRGVDPLRIRQSSLGGISRYGSVPANRHTRIELYL